MAPGGRGAEGAVEEAGIDDGGTQKRGLRIRERRGS